MSASLIPVNQSSGKYYAIELKETQFKHFRELGESTEITFRWEDLLSDIHQTRNELTIQVAQKNPNSPIKEIKNLAQAVFESKKLQELDRIFGIVNKKIDKIGYVQDKEINSTTVRLNVNWVSQSELEEFQIPIFRENEQIQLLKAKDLATIKHYYGRKIEKVYYRMPIIRTEEHEFKTIERNEYLHQLPHNGEPGGKIRLFYGTNRNAEDKLIYGNEEDELKQGICDVSIPMGHVPGAMERPNNFWIVKFIENKEMHVMVQDVKPMGKSEFIKHFNGTINTTKGKDALLFVHGYNSSFEEAARRTAQLAWDLPFEGFSGFFSWPSNAKIPHYLADEAAARSAAPALAIFLEQFILDTELEQLHIIAHSMGSLVTTLSLNSLRNGGSMASHLNKIQQLVLGAPDIDQTEFRNSILPTFKKIGKRRTLYASDHDLALWASSMGRANRLRLGQIGKELFLDHDLDTIEASNLATQSSHSYIFQSKQLLTDLFYLISRDLDPTDRRLREVNSSVLPYWLFLE